jgi:hypothetical protein
MNTGIIIGKNGAKSGPSVCAIRTMEDAKNVYVSP